jgi:inhibitor of cysteine peptidase
MQAHRVVALLTLFVAGLGAALASCEPAAERPSGEPDRSAVTAQGAGGEKGREGEASEKEESMAEEAEEGEVIRRLAQVEELELVLLKSFPLQVRATVRGTLPDACTEIDAARQEREGTELRVTLTTRRPADALCAQVIGHFQETIPLEVHGLPAGTYEVVVNDRLRESFTFQQDNVLRPGT